MYFLSIQAGKARETNINNIDHPLVLFGIPRNKQWLLQPAHWLSRESDIPGLISEVTRRC